METNGRAITEIIGYVVPGHETHLDNRITNSWQIIVTGHKTYLETHDRALNKYLKKWLCASRPQDIFGTQMAGPYNIFGKQ